MPRPELERLQRERLRERFGVEPESLPELPFRVKSELRDAYPFGLLQVPLEECVRIHASSGTRGKATIVAYTRATSRPGRTVALARSRGGRGAGHCRPQRLWLRPVHRRPGPPLRRRADGLHGRPGVGRQHAAPGHAAPGLRRRDPLLHAVATRCAIAEHVAEPDRPARLRRARRLRRRAVDRRRCARRSSARWAHRRRIYGLRR